LTFSTRLYHLQIFGFSTPWSNVVEEMELGSDRLFIDQVDLMLQHQFLVEWLSKIRRLRGYFD